MAQERHGALSSPSCFRYVAVAAMVVATVACNGSEPVTDDPYRADFEAAAEEATSDFERTVLGDLNVTRAEYEEAVNRYIQCANDRGLQLSAVSQGGYYVFQHQADSLLAAEGAEGVAQECRVGTIELVEPLYVNKLTNPNKEDRDELVVACFIDRGLVSNGYTVDAFKEDRGSGQEQRSPDFPFDERDPRFMECMANPSQ